MMKKLITTLVAGMVMVCNVYLTAQPIFTINPSNVNANPGDQITVDIVVADFDNVLSLQYSMNWNTAILDYVSVSNLSIDLNGLSQSSFGTSGVNNGDLSLSWFDPDVTGITLPDNTVLYTLTFDVLSSMGTDITFSGDPVIIEIIDGNGNEIGFTPTNGTVNGGGTTTNPEMTVSASSESGQNGDLVCVDFSVEDFTDLTDFSFSLTFDESIIDFDNFDGLNLTGLTNSDFDTSNANNGELSLTWSNPTGVTVADNTDIFQACFTLVGTGGQTSNITFADTPVAISATDTNNDAVMVNTNNGIVNINTPPPTSTDFTITATDVVGNVGDEVCVEVSVDNFDNILSFQWSMNFDPSLIEFTQVQGLNLQDLGNGNFGTGGVTNGNLTVSWFDDTNVSGVTVADGTVIFEVCFNILGTGTSGFDFSGSPTVIEVIDGNDNNVPATFVDGSAGTTGTPPPPPTTDFTITATDVVGNVGDEVCVEVSVDNFDNILSFQWSMNFDPTLIEFTQVQGLNLQDLGNGNFGTGGVTNGNLTVSWFDDTNVSGVTVADGTVIFEVCFNILGAGTSSFDFTGSPTVIEVIDGDDNPVPATFNDGSVGTTGNPPPPSGDFTVSAPDVSGDVGDEVCLDVSVSGFDNILSFQWSMNFDPNVVEFTQVQGLNLPDLGQGNFGTGSADNGILTVSWFDDTNVSGVTVADGTVLFQVCFNILAGGTSDFDFTGNPTVIEVIDGDDNNVPATFNNGSITGDGAPPPPPTPDGFNIIASDINFVSSGDDFCLDFSVVGFDNILSAQYSMNFDPNLWQFQSIQGINLQDLGQGNFGTNSASNGQITFSWFDDTNATGVTVADNTVIYQICFTAIGPNNCEETELNFTSNPTIIEVVDGDDNAVQFNGNPGVVVVGIDCAPPPETLELNFSDIDVIPGSNICIPLTVENFVDVVSFQFSVCYNENVLDFTGFQNFTTGLNDSFGPGDTNPNFLTVAWDDDLTLGNNLPDGATLVELCFDVIGNTGQTGCVEVCGTPTVIEVSNDNSQIVPVNTGEGCLSVVNNCDPITVTSAPITNVLCNGANTGQIDITDAGGSGTGTNTYTWRDETGIIIANTSDLTGVGAGTYTLTITCGGGAETFTENYTITEPDPINIAVVSVNDVGCTGDNTGSINLNVTGGNGGFTYLWNSSVAIGANPSGLLAGNYVVTVTDAQNCTAVSNLIEITQPSSLMGSATVVNAACAGETGSITINANGGTPNYTYAINPAAGTLSGSTFLNVPAGNYVPTIVDDNGCTLTLNLTTVTAPQSITINLLSSINDSDNCNGALNVNIAGGSGNFTVSWSSPDPDITFNSTNQNIDDLCGGEYCITVTDVVGNCMEEACFEVIKPLEVTLDGEPRDACFETCDGAATLQITGGDTPYTIDWGNGPTMDNSFDQLCGGTTTVTVTSADNQMTTIDIVIDEPTTALQILSANIGGTSAPTICDGQISIVAAGGYDDNGYEYDWNLTAQNTANIDNLCAANYIVTITDDNGCTIQGGPYGVAFVPNQLNIADTTNVDVSCFGDNNGTLTVGIEGGLAPYTVEIAGPGGFSQSLTGTGPFNLNNLVGGVYNIQVTDDIASGQFDMVNVLINEPAEISVTKNKIVDSVNGSIGSVDITPNGGTPAYDFNWSNGSSAQNPQLPVGVYDLTITDGVGCVKVFQDEVTIYNLRVLNVDFDEAPCPEDEAGNIDITVVPGNNMPFTYQWTDASTGFPVGQGEDLLGVPSGDYNLVVTDSCGLSFETTVTLNAQSDLKATLTSANNFNGFDLQCFGDEDGEILLDVQDAPAPITTAWSDVNAPNNLSAGSYTVTITDGVGCTLVESITLTQPNELGLILDVTNVACAGEKNGRATVSAFGGVNLDGYEFVWDTGSEEQTIFSLGEGNYTVLVQDDNNCSVDAVAQIIEPEALVVNVITSPVTETDLGSATVVVSGGTAPYSYFWGATFPETESQVDLDAGTYMVVVSDSVGCQVATTADVEIDAFCLDTRNTISPNGDGLNENFIIRCINNFSNTHLEIYNRWGQLVYEVDNYDNSWEGTNRRGNDVEDGTYFFVFDYTDNFTGDVGQRRGHITIIRD